MTTASPEFVRFAAMAEKDRLYTVNLIRCTFIRDIESPEWPELPYVNFNSSVA